MRAVKVYNNNAVSTIFFGQKEAMLIGSGIGFNKKPGDLIDEGKIEKIYYIQDEFQTKLLQLLENVQPEVLEAAEDIVQYATNQGLEVKSQLIISLADHIDFAIERLEKGMELPYLMLTETRLLYKKEYEIAVWALKRIEELLHVQLPEDETGYITLKIASFSMHKETAYDTLEFVSGVLDIIKEIYGIEMDSDQINTMRLITHLKFLAQRIFDREQWRDDNMEEIHSLLLKKNPKNRECIRRLKKYVSETFSYQMNSQEEVYLMIHLNKILN